MTKEQDQERWWCGSDQVVAVGSGYGAGGRDAQSVDRVGGADDDGLGRDMSFGSKFVAHVTVTSIAVLSVAVDGATCAIAGGSASRRPDAVEVPKIPHRSHLNALRRSITGRSAERSDVIA
jgi:hypothetical protein